jgi:leader peptidase (prepilin peptidase)/N-methyltransferase
MPDVIVAGFAAVLGAAIGSFLNVCICRLPERMSVVAPRSHCPECETPIAWRDNIPILSWFLLRGRCRECRSRISPVYPAVEAATALIWMAAVLRHGVSWQALTLAVFFTILLGAAATDARTYIIPDEFTFGGLAIGLLLSMTPGGLTFWQSLGGAAVGFTLLYSAALLGDWFLGKESMGGGDIKMIAMVGAFLGPYGAVLTIFLGSLVGSIVFLPISLRTSRLVPFGIFLALGAAITEVWGPGVLTWYRVDMLGY